MRRGTKIWTGLVMLVACAACSSDGSWVVLEESENRRILRFEVGPGNVYVVEEEGRRLMIDAGDPGDEDRYEALMLEAGIDPSSIEHLVVTHGHVDHAGTASAFQQRHGVRVIGGADDQPMIDAGGRADLCPTSWLARMVQVSLGDASYPPFRLDRALPMDGPPVDLAEFGMSGTILPQSGHTPGSVVVIIGRHAFVGDLIRGGIFSAETPTTHFFMCDLAENRRRMRELLAYGEIELWHPGHFGPFTPEQVEAYLEE